MAKDAQGTIIDVLERINKLSDEEKQLLLWDCLAKNTVTMSLL